MKSAPEFNPMRGGSTALMVLVLFSSALSGCLMEGLNAEADAPNDTEACIAPP